MLKYITDIAGIRIICSFTQDIYRIADMLAKQSDLRVVELTDYITHPKVSGYRSYHMLVAVPVHLSDRVVDIIVEVQIRTIAQDFWASLEHKIYYKFEGSAPEYISKDLRACAEFVAELDDKMLSLNEAIQSEALRKAEKPDSKRGVTVKNSYSSLHRQQTKISSNMRSARIPLDTRAIIMKNSMCNEPITNFFEMFLSELYLSYQ